MDLFNKYSKNKTSSDNVGGLKNEMSHLERLHKSNQEDGKELKDMIDDIHKRLKNLDDKTSPKTMSSVPAYSILDMQTMEDKLILHNKITIKKRRKSKSFSRWLFNNNDL